MIRFIFSLSSAWAVLLDRSQQKLQIVLLPPALFIPVSMDDPQWEEHVEAMPEGVQPFIIYEEITDIWINVRPFNNKCSGALISKFTDHRLADNQYDGQYTVQLEGGGWSEL